MIEPSNTQLSVSLQCSMVNIQRSSYYDYIREKERSDQDIEKIIEEIYAEYPEYGSRRVTEIIRRHEISINRKKVQRLMRKMNIQGLCPKPNLSVANCNHKKYPYIARDKPITKINQVWSTDITYIKTLFGTVYLVAIVDWYSRFVLSWRLSNSIDENFCIDALLEALQMGTPEIFNTDQGSQFTGNAFISILTAHGIQPSMDGKGRATDNAHSERIWRSVKWEELYMYEQKDFVLVHKQVTDYFKFYNHERPHQSLNYKTPSEVHFDLEKKLFDSDGKIIYTERELKYVVR
jgi:putative transposase